jgi:hypothetical protein
MLVHLRLLVEKLLIPVAHVGLLLLQPSFLVKAALLVSKLAHIRLACGTLLLVSKTPTSAFARCPLVSELGH